MKKNIKNRVILEREKSALLIIDIQERIYKVMRKHEKLLDNVLKLVKGFKILNIPIHYTEQYPKGLGSTISQIRDELSIEAVQKTSFSCLGVNNFFNQLKENNIRQIIVCGVESHVCVQQTVLD